MKRMTEKPWFGKKTVGWGAAPITWQGWVVTLVLVLIIIADVFNFRVSITTLIIAIIAILGFVIITLLTGRKDTWN